jgi:hypothetical protein
MRSGVSSNRAESSYRRMLVLEEKQFGPTSVSLTDPLERLALVLEHLGRPEEAERLLDRKQAILTASTQTRH